MTSETRHLLDSALSRRRLLQASAVAGVGAFLAACGTSGTKSPVASTGATGVTGTPAATPGASASAVAGSIPAATSGASPTEGSASRVPASAATGVFKMATWIGYIDVGSDNVSHPSLDRFTQETGVQVDYQEAVDDNESFFASQLKGPLQSGVDTGWDLVVLTDWMIIRLINLGWLEAIGTGDNYPANLADIYKTRDWDQGNVYAAPWQSGMTGIGYDRKKTGDLTSLAVFYDPKYKAKVEYLTEMRDTVGLTAILQGADPTTLTQAQFDAAIVKITEAVNSGLVRQTTGNSYVEDMANGDATLAMAWSGDVSSLLVPDQKASQDFQWRLADEGGMLWTDNMAIPKGARNKAQAEIFIQWYYIPKNAAQIEASVTYVCPVKGAADELVKINPALGKNLLIFPDQAMSARLHQFVATDIQTASAWSEAFSKAIGQ